MPARPLIGFPLSSPGEPASLMPTPADINRRMNFDIETKKALEAQGDVEMTWHTVEHHFLADRKAVLDDVARIGRMLCFAHSEIKEGRTQQGAQYWYFDLLSQTNTHLAELARQSILMFSLAEAYGAEYDGWGTSVETTADPSGEDNPPLERTGPAV